MPPCYRMGQECGYMPGVPKPAKALLFQRHRYNQIPLRRFGGDTNIERGDFVAKRRAARGVDTPLLEAALVGFDQMRRNVEEKMADIRRQLGSGDGMPGAAPGQGRRRTMSPAARRRIAAAQRKRWAAVRANAKPARAKRTMSAAARKRIAAAQRKRWALLKAQKAKPAPEKASKKAAQKAAS
jgi:hypothetical protein